MSAVYPGRVTLPVGAEAQIIPLLDPSELHLVRVDGQVHGSVQMLSGGVISYSAGREFVGRDVIDYTALVDGELVNGRIELRMQEGSTLLEPFDDFVELGISTYSDIDLAANDNRPGEGPARLATLELPRHGNVVPLAEGTVRYQPDKGYVGSDFFSYSLAEAQSVSAPAGVFVTVTLNAGEPFSDGTFFNDGTGWVPFSA